jgi:uncharacterized OsmC-like protein
MNEHYFKMKLSCHYEKPEHEISKLKVEHLAEGEWAEFDINTKAPGFLIFVYAIFTCQHMFLRKGATERGLLMESANATLELTANEEWKIQRIHIAFQVNLKSGSPSQADVEYITNQMMHCPVSRNLKEVPDNQAFVEFK